MLNTCKLISSPFRNRLRKSSVRIRGRAFYGIIWSYTTPVGKSSNFPIRIFRARSYIECLGYSNDVERSINKGVDW